MQYNTDDIVIHNWAKLTQTPEGKWNRIWNIILQKNVSGELDLDTLQKKLSKEDFLIKVNIDNGNNLQISVTTERWGWEDELYFATYKMFEEIDRLFGTIDTIQGQDRDLWEPWLRKKWKTPGLD
jgi:hypothetical protein